MNNFEYRINIRLKNTKPIKLADLSSLFNGIENEYWDALGKSFELQIPTSATSLAISEVKPGSQIFTIVALVAADCLFPQMNQAVILSFYDYLVNLLSDFRDNKPENINKYSKRNCKNTENITSLYTNDFGMSMEISAYQNNLKIKEHQIANKDGMAINTNATRRLDELNETKAEAFEGRLMYFHQTQNTSKSTGDKVIIKEFSEQAKKIEFATPVLKEKVIGTKDNFYKHLYRANGFVNYQQGKIKSYKVTEIEVVRDGEYN